MERCKDCRYFRKLKHHFRVGQGFEHSFCCVALADVEEGDVIEVTENGMCEMFTYKKGKEIKDGI